MKIAISNDNDFVAEHFGRCKKYSFFEIENGEIISKEEEACPEHDIGIVPEFLKKNGAEIVLTQGAGPRAINILKYLGIEIILVKKKSVQETLNNFLNDKLDKKENECEHLK
jgi:predicted Fe-Mo cluster-binding NifX family protein